MEKSLKTPISTVPSTSSVSEQSGSTSASKSKKEGAAFLDGIHVTSKDLRTKIFQKPLQMNNVDFGMNESDGIFLHWLFTSN